MTVIASFAAVVTSLLITDRQPAGSPLAKANRGSSPGVLCVTRLAEPSWAKDTGMTSSAPTIIRRTAIRRTVARSTVIRSTGAGAALGCAVLLAGCGSAGSPAAAPATTVTVKATSASTAPSGTSPASTGSAAPSTAASPAAAAGAPPCPTRYLAAKAGIAQGTAGSIYQVIDFTNISNTTCTLYGYPGVALAGGSPVKQIGLPAAESPVSARQLVTLPPKGVANVLLQIADAHNFPAASCHLANATYLQIIPPGQTTPIYLGYSSPTCASAVRTLTVSVVLPGAGSSS